MKKASRRFRTSWLHHVRDFPRRSSVDHQKEEKVNEELATVLCMPLRTKATLAAETDETLSSATGKYNCSFWSKKPADMWNRRQALILELFPCGSGRRIA